MLSKLLLPAIPRKIEKSNAEVRSYNTHFLHELHKTKTIQWYESKHILHISVSFGFKIPFLLETSFPLFIFPILHHFFFSTDYGIHQLLCAASTINLIIRTKKKHGKSSKFC